MSGRQNSGIIKLAPQGKLLTDAQVQSICSSRYNNRNNNNDFYGVLKQIKGR
jgi:hypothetical protein